MGSIWAQCYCISRRCRSVFIVPCKLPTNRTAFGAEIWDSNARRKKLCFSLSGRASCSAECNCSSKELAMGDFEDEEEALSSSDLSNSSDDYVCVHEKDLNGEEDFSGQSPSNPPPSSEDCKSKTVDALVRGNLIVKRQSLLPRILSVSEGAAVCRKPFKPPCASGYSDGKLAVRLGARRRFVPWGSSRAALVTITNRLNVPSSFLNEDKEEIVTLPPGVEPLVLWQPEEAEGKDGNLKPIIVDPLLVRFLRPHQREGVQFMFECISGLCGSPNINGCILADDMGLGKTLQSITLLYTILRQGFDGKPMVKKAIIVTPTSLVGNWEAEVDKWVGDRVQLIALCESTREDVMSGINSFINPRSSLQVLIVSYETFRMHASKFGERDCCDLLICDEAHRLKNNQTLTNRALAALSCKRRILLSGTPMQNDLEEFFAMVNFTNPGILGDAAHFRRYYETPIICGREPNVTEEEKDLGAERSAELSATVNQFILRRTNALLSNHLPPKAPKYGAGWFSHNHSICSHLAEIVEVVCCKLTSLQHDLYNHFIHSKNVKRAITDETKQSKILAYITALKKLCNHPKLIYDTIRNGGHGNSGIENCIQFFPPEMFSGRSGSWTGGDGAWVELSGKMHILARLLAHLRHRTDDRIVLVSNYTQTLDLFAQLCRERRYPYLRLDGTTSISKRQKLVNRFNDPSKDEFVFLLSSKAGGCGLNLIGGNRLVLFDPDWNPANDKQAAARVWRDGQKKRVYIYRFLSAGTIEEKVYQRQMSKEGLQKVIQQEQTDGITAQGNFFSTEDLRDLFSFSENVSSEIHEKMNCIRCQSNEDGPGGLKDVDAAESSEYALSDQETTDIGGFAAVAGCLNKLKGSERQIGTPLEEDLGSWGHHFLPTSVPDALLQAAAGDEVTFVFTNQVDGKLVPTESTVRPTLPEKEGTESRSNVRGQVDQRSTRISQYQKQPTSTSRENINNSTPSSPIPQKIPIKAARTLKGGVNVSPNPKPSLASKLPLKRSYPHSVEQDDDFQ